MLKHAKLTSGRVSQFIQYELKERLLGERAAMKIEYCAEPFATESEARKGQWKEVQPGFAFGPAYRTVWFRVSGKVPKEFAGKEVGLIAEVGGERTIWRDNSPWRGIDEPHSVCRLFESAAGGEKVSLYIQSYTRNPQCRVHRHELPREELVEKVDRVELVTVDRELTDLYYDCEFAYNLATSLDEKDPAQVTIMRALNEVVNVYAWGAKESIGRCRKILRDALGSLNGEIKHTITPVGHAHLDTAWLWPLEITRKKMAHTTATQLDLLERYPEYVFVHSQASQYEWLEQDYPLLLKKVKQAIARGQWEPVGSMWVEADCNLSGGEALVRQFLYGRRYFREKLGYQTQDMWLPDVFGYSAALPQILAKFGIRYFLTQKISWNQFNKFPHHTFWWQGIDGTKVWTHFPPADTYCGNCTPEEILRSVKNYQDHSRSDHSLYAFGYGDGGGGPTEKHLELLRRARLAPSMPEIAGGKKALGFFREAKAKSKDLLTWTGELYLEYHRGTYTSQAKNKRYNRLCEFLLRDAELLACFTGGFPDAYPQRELERIWKLVLLNQFHDIIPGSSVNEVYRDSDRDYEDVVASADRLIADSIRSIAGNLDTSGMSRPVAIYHGATAPALAKMPWAEGEAPTSVVHGDESLPVQLVEEFDGRKLIFPAPQAAACAVAVANLGDSPAGAKNRLKVSARRIENGDLSVRFDAHGNITSIQSLDDGAEYVLPGRLANLFQILDDKPLHWSAWDVDAFAFETARDLVRSDSVEIVERGPVRAAVQVVKRFGSSTIRQRISVGAFPGIHFDTEVDWREEDKMLKVAFPINVNASRATYEIQFGHVERPTHFNTSWDMARFEVCAQKWVDISEAEQGVALLNQGKYGHDVQGSTIRLSLLRSPKAPDPECDMGIHRFSYCLLPHYGPLHYAGIVSAAYAFNAPVHCVPLEPGPGETGNLPPFISCEDRNIVIESVKKAEDSTDLIVRLYECHNARGQAELFCARTPEAAWICDMEENNLEELDVHDGMVLFPYKPFEIVTLKLKV